MSPYPELVQRMLDLLDSCAWLAIAGVIMRRQYSSKLNEHRHLLPRQHGDGFKNSSGRLHKLICMNLSPTRNRPPIWGHHQGTALLSDEPRLLPPLPVKVLLAHLSTQEQIARLRRSWL